MNLVTLTSKHKSTVKYGINTIAFKGPLEIWQNIPLEIRNSESLRLLKSNIKEMQSLSCGRKSFYSFIANLVYRDFFLYYDFP